MDVTIFHSLIIPLVPQPIAGLQRKASSCERNCRVSPQHQRQKTAKAGVHRNKSSPVPKETFFPKTLAASNTAGKVCVSQDTFLHVRMEAALYLCVAQKVSFQTGVPTVHHDGIQGVEQGSSSCVRHVWPKIQVLRIFHKLQRGQEGSEMKLSYHMKNSLQHVMAWVAGNCSQPKQLCQRSSFHGNSLPRKKGTQKSQHLVTELWAIFFLRKLHSTCIHTLLIFAPFSWPALSRHSVRTLGARWTVTFSEAAAFFLHLETKHTAKC